MLLLRREDIPNKGRGIAPGRKAEETKARIVLRQKSALKADKRPSTIRETEMMPIDPKAARKRVCLRERSVEKEGSLSAERDAEITNLPRAAKNVPIITGQNRKQDRRKPPRKAHSGKLPVRIALTAAEIAIEGTTTDLREREPRRTMTVKLKATERIDELQRNGYRIIQDPSRFCFGMDAVLLTGFAHARPTDTLLDLGTGTGIIPLLMEAKYHCAHLTGLEIQAESADMAARSVELNGLSDKISIVTGDIKEADKIFASASFDCITCNPPYMIGQHGIVNPNAPKAIARHEVLCTFEDVAGQTAKLLKPGGHFFLVHRPFRLAEIITILVRYKLEPKRMQLVYPYVDKEPNMVLIEAVRGGRSRMSVEKPLIIFEKPGVYCPEITQIYGF